MLRAMLIPSSAPVVREGYADSAAIGAEASRVEVLELILTVLRQLLLPLRAMLIPLWRRWCRRGLCYGSVAIGTAISGLETLEGQAQGLETDVSDAQIARDSFFGAGGAGEGYADSAAIGAEASRVEGLGADFDGLEAAVVTAQGDVDTFFGTDGEGDGFADSAAIGDAAADAEEFAAGLPEDSEFAEDALLAASQLRELETRPKQLKAHLQMPRVL